MALAAASIAKGLGKFTSRGSLILVTMVAGVAVVPNLEGLLADRFWYQPSFLIVAACYAYLGCFALHGYKIRQPWFASVPGYIPPVEV